MSEANCPLPAPEEAPKPVRKKAAAAPKTSDATAPRKWEDVVPEIQKLKEAGVTVPEIAEQLQLSYVLVNQVMLQSYKMSVDTIALFERQEAARLAAQ